MLPYLWLDLLLLVCYSVQRCVVVEAEVSSVKDVVGVGGVCKVIQGAEVACSGQILPSSERLNSVYLEHQLYTGLA